MDGVKNIKKGYPGMLVFTRIVKNIKYDYETDREFYEYEDRLKAGFVKEVHKHFEDYYLIKFFTGEESYHWAADLFEKTEEIDLTYLRE